MISMIRVMMMKEDEYDDVDSNYDNDYILIVVVH